MKFSQSIRSLTQQTIGKSAICFSLMGCMVAVGGQMLFSSPTQAAKFPDISFECNQNSMFVKRTSDSYRKRIIKFSSMGGYASADRCAIVRDRLSAWNMNAGAAYLTTGMQNNQPVICMVTEWGMPCDKGAQLLTLRQVHRSPAMRERALSTLLVSLNTPKSGVLYDSTQPLYVDFKALVMDALKSEKAED
jgi:Circadian oscillating protein COP23